MARQSLVGLSVHALAVQIRIHPACAAHCTYVLYNQSPLLLQVQMESLSSHNPKDAVFPGMPNTAQHICTHQLASHLYWCWPSGYNHAVQKKWELYSE